MTTFKKKKFELRTPIQIPVFSACQTLNIINLLEFLVTLEILILSKKYVQRTNTDLIMDCFRIDTLFVSDSPTGVIAEN